MNWKSFRNKLQFLRSDICHEPEKRLLLSPRKTRSIQPSIARVPVSLPPRTPHSCQSIPRDNDHGPVKSWRLSRCNLQGSRLDSGLFSASRRRQIRSNCPPIPPVSRRCRRLPYARAKGLDAGRYNLKRIEGSAQLHHFVSKLSRNIDVIATSAKYQLPAAPCIRCKQAKHDQVL